MPKLEIEPQVQPDTAKNIGMVLYPSFDSLDAMGAFQVFHYACKMHPGSNLWLIGPTLKDLENDYLKKYRKAAKKDLVLSGENVTMGYDMSYDDYLNGDNKLDLIFIPGAMDTSTPLYFSQDMMTNPFFKVLEKAQQEAEIIASVCTGALLLGIAGLLNARKVTTHWQVSTLLAQFPEVTVVSGYPRYVVDENIVTGGGISSTIDEALAITTMLFDQETAEKAQLIMQYHPEPPVHAGDPDQAHPRIMYETSKQTTLPYKPGFYDDVSRTILYYQKHRELP